MVVEAEPPFQSDSHSRMSRFPFTPLREILEEGKIEITCDFLHQQIGEWSRGFPNHHSWVLPFFNQQDTASFLEGNHCRQSTSESCPENDDIYLFGIG